MQESARISKSTDISRNMKAYTEICRNLNKLKKRTNMQTLAYISKLC